MLIYSVSATFQIIRSLWFSSTSSYIFRQRTYKFKTIGPSVDRGEEEDYNKSSFLACPALFDTLSVFIVLLSDEQADTYRI